MGGPYLGGSVTPAGVVKEAIGFTWEVQPDGALNLCFFTKSGGGDEDLVDLFQVDLWDTGARELITAATVMLKAHAERLAEPRAARRESAARGRRARAIVRRAGGPA